MYPLEEAKASTEEAILGCCSIDGRSSMYRYPPEEAMTSTEEALYTHTVRTGGKPLHNFFISDFFF
jgi:hypothetical protein